MNVFITWCTFSFFSHIHTHKQWEKAVRFEAKEPNNNGKENEVMQCTMFRMVPPEYICEKLCWILFSIVRFSHSLGVVAGVGVACEHFACHLLHWECGRLKIGTNITSRTYVYLFVTSIQCSIQLLYINQAAACTIFNELGTGEKGRILLFKVNISRIRIHWCTEKTKGNEYTNENEEMCRDKS